MSVIRPSEDIIYCVVCQCCVVVRVEWPRQWLVVAGWEAATEEAGLRMCPEDREDQPVLLPVSPGQTA